MIENDSKKIVAEAIQKIESLGAKVSHINDSEGCESILCHGELDALIAVEKEMKEEGWHALRDEKNEKNLIISQHLSNNKIPLRSVEKESKKKVSPLQTLFSVFICLILGIIEGKPALENIILMTESAHWVSTSGVIDEEHISSTHGRGGPHYYPHVTYHFSANGIFDGIGNRFSIPDSSFSSNELAENALRAYPEGASVTIYYNPDNPSHSSIIRPHMDYFYVASEIFICGILFLVPVLVFRQYLKTRDQRL